jgi:hypothetical protein
MDIFGCYEEERVVTLAQTYRKTLEEACIANPDDYHWYKNETLSIDKVVSRMMNSVCTHGLASVNIEGALAKAIKQLTGKSTKKAGEAYLQGENVNG